MSSATTRGWELLAGLRTLLNDKGLFLFHGLQSVLHKEGVDVCVSELVQALTLTTNDLPLLRKIATAAVCEARDSNQLFRETSVWSLFLSSYCSVVGRDFLKTYIGPLIVELYEMSPPLDPSNTPKVIAMARKIISAVVGSTQDLPIVMLVLMHYVFDIAQCHLPGNGYSAVVGLFVLRFLCPAIASPKRHDLLPEDATLDIPLLKTLAMMSKYILMSCTQNRLVEHPQASEINIHLDKWALDLIMSLSRALAIGEQVAQSHLNPSDDLGSREYLKNGTPRTKLFGTKRVSVHCGTKTESVYIDEFVTVETLRNMVQAKLVSDERNKTIVSNYEECFTCGVADLKSDKKGSSITLLVLHPRTRILDPAHHLSCVVAVSTSLPTPLPDNVETCSYKVKVKFEKHEDAFQVELPCDEHFVNIVRYVAEHVVTRGIAGLFARARTSAEVENFSVSVHVAKLHEDSDPKPGKKVKRSKSKEKEKKKDRTSFLFSKKKAVGATAEVSLAERKRSTSEPTLPGLTVLPKRHSDRAKSTMNVVVALEDRTTPMVVPDPLHAIDLLVLYAQKLAKSVGGDDGQSRVAIQKVARQYLDSHWLAKCPDESAQVKTKSLSGAIPRSPSIDRFMGKIRRSRSSGTRAVAEEMPILDPLEQISTQRFLILKLPEEELASILGKYIRATRETSILIFSPLLDVEEEGSCQLPDFVLPPILHQRSAEFMKICSGLVTVFEVLRRLQANDSVPELFGAGIGSENAGSLSARLVKADVQSMRPPQLLAHLCELSTRWNTTQIKLSLTMARELAVGDVQDGWSALHQAAAAFDIDMMSMLLDTNVNVSMKNCDGSTPLHYFAKHSWHESKDPRSLSVFRSFLRRGARLAEPNNKNETALHLAILHCNWYNVEVLLSHGVDGNAIMMGGRKGTEELSCLFLAVSGLPAEGNVKMVKSLLNHNVTVLEKDAWAFVDARRPGQGPQHIEQFNALLVDMIDAARRHCQLLKCDGRLESRDTRLQAFMSSMNEEEDGLDILRLLVLTSKDLLVSTSSGMIPLQLLCSLPWSEAHEGKYRLVLEDFLLRGLSLDTENLRKETALHVAIGSANTMAVRLLLDMGASILPVQDNEQPGSEKSCMKLACEYGHVEIVKALAQNGAPATAEDLSLLESATGEDLPGDVRALFET